MNSMKRAFVSVMAVAALTGTALADMKKEIGPGEAARPTRTMTG
jgi:hypothetical protein